MKKFFTGMIAALLLTAIMGTTVFAAGSPTGEDALKQQAAQLNKNVTVATAKTPNNTIITVTKTEATTSQVTEAQNVAKQLNGGADVLAMSDLSVPDGTDLSKGVTVTLSVPGVKRGDNVYVLHQTPKGWEVLKPVSVGEGTVTVTLYSFSPIVVVKYGNGVSIPVTTNPSGNSTQTSTNTNSNNTTGDTQNNSQTNNNNQNNTQNNPVNVNQNVTVNYPDNNGDYNDGYADGYEDGRSSASGKSSSGSNTNKGSSNSSASKKTDVKSPKTGETLPVLPVAGLLALVGIGLTGRKLK